MTVREYIGARYIPLFMGDWDDTKTYEPLSIVSYQGDSYTSMQYVPAGIAITNEAYWAVTGNYNSQIEAYREETQEVANALPISDFDSTNTVKKAIDDNADLLPASAFDTTNTIDARFDVIEANSWVSTDRIADGAVTSAKIADGTIATTDIADGAVSTAKLEKPILVIFGDSWSAFGSGYQNWVEKNNFESVLNCEIKNYAVGGASFVYQANTISDQVSTASSDLTAAEKSRVKWVIVEGGVNDTSSGSYSYTDWVSAVRSVCIAITTMLPNASVMVAPNMCSVDLDLDRARLCVYQANQLCDDLQWTSGTNAYVIKELPFFFMGHQCNEVFTNDNLHLNGNGAKAFGNVILANIIGNRGFHNPMVISKYTDPDDSSKSLQMTIDYNGNISLCGMFTATSTVKSIINNTKDDFTEALAILDGKARNPKDSSIVKYNEWLTVGSSGSVDNFCWVRRSGNYSFNIRGNNATKTTYYI